MACMTMKEVFEGDMNEDNIEVGVIDEKQEFKYLNKDEIKEVLRDL